MKVRVRGRAGRGEVQGPGNQRGGVEHLGLTRVRRVLCSAYERDCIEALVVVAEEAEGLSGSGGRGQEEDKEKELGEEIREGQEGTPAKRPHAQMSQTRVICAVLRSKGVREELHRRDE